MTSDEASQQLKALREDLDALKRYSKDMHLDEALSYVRTLASRPKLTTPSIFLAAVEMIVDSAHKANHKDMIDPVSRIM